MMWRIGILSLLLAAMLIAYHHAKPDDLRDPRCDTPARYQAMSEGANCS